MLTFSDTAKLILLATLDLTNRDKINHLFEVAAKTIQSIPEGLSTLDRAAYLIDECSQQTGIEKYRIKGFCTKIVVFPTASRFLLVSQLPEVPEGAVA